MTHRPGVSVAELIVALAIFSVIMATSLGFYRQQGQAFTTGNERMSLMQNLRYGISSLEQHLRTAGIGVPAKQPVVVYADERTISFNANYASNVATDFFAVYVDTKLPSPEVGAVTPDRKFTLPGTSFAYPDSAYAEGAGNSPAETITFFFALDTSTPRGDDYVLYRQVNDRGAEILARHLVRTDRPFFQYHVVVNGDLDSPVAELSSSRLPTAHSQPIHGSPGDTAGVALVDSIRAVRVTYAATNGLEGTKEVRREISRLIRLPNAGLTIHRSCGTRPRLGTTLTAQEVEQSGTTPGYILLKWGPATDETTGERDVLRYVLWRRVNGSTGWGDPLVSLAPGLSTYTYEDRTAAKFTAYDYALAAQDCTPQYSDLSVVTGARWDS